MRLARQSLRVPAPQTAGHLATSLPYVLPFTYYHPERTSVRTRERRPSCCCCISCSTSGLAPSLAPGSAPVTSSPWRRFDSWQRRSVPAQQLATSCHLTAVGLCGRRIGYERLPGWSSGVDLAEDLDMGGNSMVTLRTSATVERLDFCGSSYPARPLKKFSVFFDLLAAAASRSAHSEGMGSAPDHQRHSYSNALSCAHAQPAHCLPALLATQAAALKRFHTRYGACALERSHAVNPIGLRVAADGSGRSHLM